MTDAEQRALLSTRKLGALSLALGVSTLLFVCYALHGAMSFNPLHLPLEEQVQSQRWLPQGWAFFTRDPQEERLFVYRRDPSGSWSPTWLTPHSRPENAFGMNRASRAQGLEGGQLFEHVPSSAFQPCVGGVPACLESLAASISLENPMPRKTLCGSIAIVKQRPLPWAWRDWNGRVQMPAVAARLEVSC